MYSPYMHIRRCIMCVYDLMFLVVHLFKHHIHMYIQLLYLRARLWNEDSNSIIYILTVESNAWPVHREEWEDKLCLVIMTWLVDRASSLSLPFSSPVSTTLFTYAWPDWKHSLCNSDHQMYRTVVGILHGETIIYIPCIGKKSHVQCCTFAIHSILKATLSYTSQ